MVKLIRIGLDTSKSVLQLLGVNAREEVVLRKKLRRAQILRHLRRRHAHTDPAGPCNSS
jgi:transposase